MKITFEIPEELLLPNDDCNIVCSKDALEYTIGTILLFARDTGSRRKDLFLKDVGYQDSIGPEKVEEYTRYYEGVEVVIKHMLGALGRGETNLVKCTMED